MSNLETAKVALEAELAQARKGFAYYQSRIDALGKALQQLLELDDATGKTSKPAAPTGKRGRKPGKHLIAKAKKKPTSGKVAAGNELPSTGGDFWPNLITLQPQSGADILHAAIDGLGFTPTKLQVQKLTNRLTFALHALVKAGKIADSGVGRARRFFKA